MCRVRMFLTAVIVLTIALVAKAELTLTVNGLDATELPEINATKDLIIAIVGEKEAEAQDISLTADSGSLEMLPEPNMLAEEPTSVKYLFNFTDEGGADAIRLTAGDELIYQLVLFSVPDENKTVIFGIDAEALAASQTQQNNSELEIPTDFNETEPKTFLQLPERTIVPYAERMAQEKAQSLKFCPSGITSKEFLSTKESKDREFTFGGTGGGVMMEGDGVIDVSSDITSNTVWTSDNTYHVVADVNVQALLVIEPGTVVSFAYDTAMFINNGGTLISCGTPDNLVIYTSDSASPEYADYYCPIYIEETASVSTKVTYSYIEYAYTGIAVLNKRLATNIENNYFYSNVFGIVEFGLDHTDITNNLFYGSGYGAIEIYMESLTGEATSDSHIYIQNNTCDYSPQWDGISVYGVPEVNDAGFVLLGNNLVSNNGRYGLVLANGYMYASVLNTGYYGNADNKNWEFDETNPVIETEWPYREGTGWLPVCYLDQNCDFIDAGQQYIEQTHLIGKTTDVDSQPDSNYTDIGFHYPNWNFSNPGSGDTLSADLDDSMRVDFNDFAIFANYWQQSTTSEADLDDSGFVDYNDLSIFTNQWLQVADPNIEIHIYGDSNDGYINIGVSGFSSGTKRIFLLANGNYIREIFAFRYGRTLAIDTSEFDGGEQQLKTISIGNSDRVTCSNITDVAFSCPLNYCLVPSSYEPNKPLYFSALSSGAEDVSVNVYADCGNLVWSQIYSGNNVLGSIPAEITSQYEIDYISFDTTSGESIAKVTDPKEPDISFDVKALIVIPDFLVRLFDYRTIWAVQTALKDRGIKYKKLSLSSANYENVAWYAATNPIKYLYVGAEGHYELEEDVLRTNIDLYDGTVVSIKQSDFVNPDDAPSWCEYLGGYWEETTKSFFSMGFNSLEFAQFDCCYSGHLKINADNQLVEGQPGQIGVFDGPHSDMSLALGMGETSISRAYQGWYGEYEYKYWPFETEYQKWTQLEWEELGDGESLYWALMHVISQQTEFGPDDPVNNYRLKGQGSLMDIELSQ